MTHWSCCKVSMSDLNILRSPHPWLLVYSHCGCTLWIDPTAKGRMVVQSFNLWRMWLHLVHCKGTVAVAFLPCMHRSPELQIHVMQTRVIWRMEAGLPGPSSCIVISSQEVVFAHLSLKHLHHNFFCVFLLQYECKVIAEKSHQDWREWNTALHRMTNDGREYTKAHLTLKLPNSWFLLVSTSAFTSLLPQPVPSTQGTVYCNLWLLHV